jgi:hypothetical protein
MSVYQGIRIEQVCMVRKDAYPLSPRWSQSVRNHSPAGFNWGYQGSGPAQLALALLLEETEVREARRAYQDFKRQVVSRWGDDQWACTSEAIHTWLALWRKEHEFEDAEVQEEEFDAE